MGKFALHVTMLFSQKNCLLFVKNPFEYPTWKTIEDNIESVS